MSERVPFDPPYTADDLDQLDALHEAAGVGTEWRTSDRRAEIESPSTGGLAMDINKDGIAIITSDGVSERTQPAPIDPSLLDDVPRGSFTIDGPWDSPTR